MILATLDTEHFYFVAVAETEQKAKTAIVKKFNERAPKRMNAKQLDEWYSINLQEIKLNECIRF